MRWSTRAAVAADAAEIARINVAGWRAAYRDILPAAMLAEMRAAERVDGWRARVTERPGAVQVAVDRAGLIGAYCVATAERPHDDAAPHGTGTGELAALYADPAFLGTGAGHAAHDAGLAWLSGLGYRHAVLWVLRDNPRARRFYAAHGWIEDGATGMFEVRGSAAAELRYRRMLGTDQPIG